MLCPNCNTWMEWPECDECEHCYSCCVCDHDEPDVHFDTGREEEPQVFPSLREYYEFQGWDLDNLAGYDDQS